MVGKVSPKLMEKIVYRNLGAVDPEVLVGPTIGEVTVVGRVREYLGCLVEVIKGSSSTILNDVYVTDELFHLLSRIKSA
jgi:hypothetical protein